MAEHGFLYWAVVLTLMVLAVFFIGPAILACIVLMPVFDELT